MFIYISGFIWHGKDIWNPSSWQTRHICLTYLFTWLLITWWHDNPGHQQLCHWPTYPGIFQFQHRKRVIVLTHWGRLMHICVSKLTIIGSDNGLSPGRRQAIIWTNAGILLIRTSGTNFSEILNEILAFSFKKMHLHFHSRKCIWKCRLRNGVHFVSASMC